MDLYYKQFLNITLPSVRNPEEEEEEQAKWKHHQKTALPH